MKNAGGRYEEVEAETAEGGMRKTQTDDDFNSERLDRRLGPYWADGKNAATRSPVAAAIREARLRCDLTLAELASEFHTSKSRLSRWENSDDIPTPTELRRLGEILNVPDLADLCREERIQALKEGALTAYRNWGPTEKARSRNIETMKEPKTVGDFIRFYRTVAGYPLREAAKQLGIGIHTLRSMESSQLPRDRALVEKAAELFNAPELLAIMDNAKRTRRKTVTPQATEELAPEEI